MAKSIKDYQLGDRVRGTGVGIEEPSVGTVVEIDEVHPTQRLRVNLDNETVNPWWLENSTVEEA